MVRSIASVLAVLVLLSVPLNGSLAVGTYSFDISVYNSGFIVPDTYFYIASSAYVDDGGMISSDDYYISGYVALVSGVSGMYGNVSKTFTFYNSDFYRDALGLRPDDVFEWSGKHYIFAVNQPLDLYSYVAPVSGRFNEVEIELKYQEPSKNLFNLVSEYPMYSVLLNGEYDMQDTTLFVILQKYIFQGISINGSYATSSDAASVDDLLTLPTPPPAQRDFIDDTSIARFGYYVGSFVPHALLLPLFSFIGFCLLMSLFALIKHA